ncbi:MAG TPA: ABC transporter substrate-binding protein [Corynebacterium sp.]|nr:ABC transporter substrate-binding protein [Corynebacterium sp.]
MRRSRTLTTLASLTAVALLATGCTTASESEQSTAAAGEGTITVTDQRGMTVTLDGPAESIASAVIPAPAIIAAVDGSWDRITGINQSLLDANKLGIISQIFPESITTPVISGPDFIPNMEEVLAANPDVVVQWGDMGTEVISPLEQAGLPVIGLEYGTQEDLETWIDLFGDIVGKPERAEEIIDWMHTEAESISAQVEQLDVDSPRALSLSYSQEALSVDTASDYAQQVFDLTGLSNVAEDAPVTDGVVGAEQIIEWDPEIIFLSAFAPATPQDVYDDPRLAEVSAVKEQRVYRAPLGVYRWQVPSAESPLYWNWVAALAYPGQFEVDLPAEMREQTAFLYNYELSAEDIALELRTDINDVSADYDLVSR